MKNPILNNKNFSKFLVDKRSLKKFHPNFKIGPNAWQTYKLLIENRLKEGPKPHDSIPLWDTLHITIMCHELESHARVGIPRVSTPLDLSLLGAANFLQWVCVNLVLANWSRMGRGCWSSHEQVFNIYIHVQIHNHLYSRYSKFVWMNVCLQNILFVWLSYKWISLSLSLVVHLITHKQ